MMGRLGSAALVVLIAIATCLNEAESMNLKMKMRLKSKEEIMNQTTVESAVKLVLSKGKQLKPELAALLQKKFGHLSHSHSHSHAGAKGAMSLRKVNKHVAEPTGYSAVEGAVHMLAEMMLQTMATFDELESVCTMFDTSQFNFMSDAKNAIAFFNAEANTALARMLDSQGKIGVYTHEKHNVQDRRYQMQKLCAEDLASTRHMLSVVTADVRVIGLILNLTKCEDETQGMLLQTGTDDDSNSSGEALVSCDHCNGGKGMVMLQNPKVQLLLNKLKTMYAQDELQKQLHITFHRAAQQGKTPVALTQTAVAHQMKLTAGLLAKSRTLRKLHERLANETQELNPVAYSLDVSDEPSAPVPLECTPTTKCTLSAASCPLLNERFEAIHGGLVEKMEELTRDLAELEHYCEAEEHNMELQITGLTERLGDQQAKFAGGVGDKDTAESGSQAKAHEYDMLSHEYDIRTKECCDQLNEQRSEQCALRKIREELTNMEGLDLFAVDCDVSDWIEQECTATCGGGERTSLRNILVSPQNNGMPCPELEKREPCNELPCPVDCVLGDWGGFGACNAECGGGLRERTRTVMIESAHFGDPCGERTDTEPCNSQACDVDCVLEDWTAWSMCSALCDGGSQRRTRGVATPAKGTGICPEPDNEPLRMQFQPCNLDSCQNLLPSDRTTVRCTSKVDIIIALDGSASLFSTGWKKQLEFTERLISNLEGGDKVHVALETFSYKQEWVSHFTNDTEKLASEVKDIRFPRSATYTHLGLIAAERELLYGREDANAVVVVVTDGYPTFRQRTKDAANSLKKKARILWVPVGRWAPYDYVEELASKPVKEHVVAIPDLDGLTDAQMINRVLAHSCPMLQ